MTDLADKWNRIYARDASPGRPAHILTGFVSLLPASGVALDIACGTGANATFLARHGMTVDAWDVSSVAITALAERSAQENLAIRPLVRNVSAESLVPDFWDVIVNCHYLDREIVPAMRSALKPGGLICFQTFTRDKVADIGPTNPDFLLAPGELRSFAEGMEILAIEDGTTETDTSHPLAGRACMVARKPG